MIMADKIIELRKKNGWSQEDLAEHLGVSRQAVSKWEGALSVPDINKVIAMSSLFGVSTDYLLKDDAKPEETLPAITQDVPDVTDREIPVRWVSLEETNRFLQINTEAAKQIALGVFLCILSPIFVMVLSALGEQGKAPFTEDQGGIFGSMIFLILVAGAVYLFVRNGLRLSAFDYLEKENIETEYGVNGVIKEKQQAFEHTHMLFMTTGVMLCVAGALPLLFCSMLNDDNDLLISAGASVTLAIIAVGVYLIVRVSIIWGGYQRLLEEGDYTRKTKRTKNSAVLGIYWAVVTAIYLGYSFMTMDWFKSWIIWPVAGVLSVAVSKVVEMVQQ